MLAREHGVDLKLDSSGRIAGLIQRQCAISQLAAQQGTRYALGRSR
ncbi:MAG: hypothetical protein MZV70_53800 [Desulfobacterales bacterium]|nr:hypothetical protein [Desulfobacterales bacterium]